MKKIYTDGAGSNQKTLCGGWAFVVYDDDKVIHSAAGGATYTTNNRMEMTALIEGMKYSNKFEDVTFYIDSAYIVNCLKEKWYLKWRTNGWVTSKKTPVLNKDLWEQILELYENSCFKIEKVKAHSTTEGNILADSLAVEQKKKKEGELLCKEL